MSLLRKNISKSRFVTILFLILVLFSNCNPSNQQISNKIFSCSLPYNLEYVDIPLSDYTGYIILEKKDTLRYNIGYVVSSLTEIPTEYVYIPIDLRPSDIDSTMIDSTMTIVRRRGYDSDRMKRQNVFFEKNGSKIKKITLPVDTTRGGIVGVYIDSLGYYRDFVLEFNAFFEYTSLGNYKRNQSIVKSTKLNKVQKPEFYRKTLYVY